jgi:HEAT repeat protein
VVAFGAATATAQNNAKEITGRKQAELIEILKNPKATTFEKAKACQRLAVVGTKDAVPALAALLADEHLNCYARCGLEGIADPAADEALREAAAKLHGRQLVGMLISIGQRRDAKAVDLLRAMLTEWDDDNVALAAAHALGRIGTPEAAKALDIIVDVGNHPSLWTAGDAWLTCAERLAAAGEKNSALLMYEDLIVENHLARPKRFPKHIKVAALLGVFRLEGAEAKRILLHQLRSPDKDFFNVSLAVAREMPGAEVTAALAGELEKLPPERMALLLLALGDRKDAPPLGPIVAAAKNESPAVRQAAIYVLARHGNASTVAILLDVALGGGEVARTALESLKSIPGEGVDAAIIARLKDADPAAKALLIGLVGARRIVAADPAVRQALADPSEPVRLAAIEALGQLVGLSDLDLLTRRAFGEGSRAEHAAARDALRTAALRISDREACAAKLAASLKGNTPGNQEYLLELLGRLGGRKALETVVANSQLDDAVLKDIATRVLGEWPDADAAPALLEIAQGDPDVKYRLRALRGYIRIARQLKMADDARMAMFEKAISTSQRDEDDELALQILTRIRSVKAMDRAVACLGTSGIKNAAADVAVKIAAKLAAQEPQAVAAAMKKVLAADVAPATALRARQLLDQTAAGM